MKTTSIEKVGLFLSIGLFIFSLTQKCYCTDGGGCGDSIAVFISGWMGVLLGGAALTWLANPLIFASWILTLKKNKLALYFSLSATLVCLSFLWFDKIIADEAGNYKTIIDYKAGYWLWTTSATVMLFGNLLLRKTNR